MFEDDVTVPAGWYPDPMGLPQLRWWNNHAWTELTTEARPPLVMQTPTRLAYADEELPTRRQQREQRERDEQYAHLATDEDDARDAAAANAPLTVTLREIEPPAPEESPDDQQLDDRELDRASGSAATGWDSVDDDDAVDDGDREQPATSTPASAATGYDTIDFDAATYDAVTRDAAEPTPTGNGRTGTERTGGRTASYGTATHDSVNYDTIDYDGASASAEPAAFGPRSAFTPTEGSVLGSPPISPVRNPTTPVSFDTAAFDELFQPRSANSAVSGSTAQNVQAHAPQWHADADSPRSLRQRSIPRLQVYTASVWIIALIPLLLLVLSLLLLLGFGSTLNMWVTPGIWAASWLFVVILAIADRAALGRAGYEHRASWAWALLTAPVYLIARSMSLAKVGPLGFAPVLVWAALGILQAGSVLVVPGLIISALPNAFTMQAEQSIASDASIIGADLTVDCAKSLPVLIGQTFTCAAKTASGQSYDVTVTLQRTNGWIDWHVDDWGIYTLSR